MQLSLHATRQTPHSASRLVQAMSDWSVKTRRAPPRHCRDARIFGHTTTAMHEIEYTAPPPSCLGLEKKSGVSFFSFRVPYYSRARGQ